MRERIYYIAKFQGSTVGNSLFHWQQLLLMKLAVWGQTMYDWTSQNCKLNKTHANVNY